MRELVFLTSSQCFVSTIRIYVNNFYDTVYVLGKFIKLVTNQFPREEKLPSATETNVRVGVRRSVAQVQSEN